MKPPQGDWVTDLPPAEPILDRALALVEYLRARCAWDAAQTSRSLLRYLLEESNEVADAILREDAADLQDELGDLLLNLGFQIVIAEEQGHFDRAGVVAKLEAKMRRRHPHLWGSGPAEPWQAIKARERAGQPQPGAASLLDAVPPGLDPLARAERLQARAACVGFDWPHARGAWDKVREELEEVREELDAGNAERLEEELGDLFFAMVNLVRLAGASAPACLAGANAKFAARFRAIERFARERGLDMETASLDELDALWDEAKRTE